MSSPLLNTYQRLPVHFVRGEGCWLYDANGKRYLDAIAGLAVSTLGHQHPALVETLQHSATLPLHVCNLFTIPEQEALAAQLQQLTGMSHAYFCNSGAEANEAAIKIARLYASTRHIDHPIILTMNHSFHGRTYGAASATNTEKVRAGIGPLLPGFIVCEFGNIEDIQQHQDNPNVVAVMLECIQGDGGVNLPPPGYLKQLHSICQRQQWLMMIDEVQTGCGRTGKFCAYQHEGITPDVVTLAKGLGGGYPIGACLTQGIASNVITPGKHGSTYGGNPLACKMAQAVLTTIQQAHLIEHAEKQGKALLHSLQTQLDAVDCVHAIRGQGLIIGIELKAPITDLPQHFVAAGLLVSITQQKIIRLLPPLIISKAHIDFIADTIKDVLTSR